MTANSHHQPDATRQFSLRSLLCTIVTISIVLAYVRLFGEEGIQLAFINLALGIVIGGIGGWSVGRFVETLTWSLVGGTLALCCVLTEDRLPRDQQLYWLVIGTFGSMLAGAVRPGHVSWRIGLILVTWLCCLAYWIVWYSSVNFWLLDALATLPALGFFAIVAEVYSL